MSMKAEILLLGATGYTGKLIAGKLLAQGLAFTAVARDMEVLKEFQKQDPGLIKIQSVNFNNADPLQIIADHQIIINCAGPFNIYGAAWVDACIALGRSYIDITGEQHIVAESFAHKKETSKRSGSR